MSVFFAITWNFIGNSPQMLTDNEGIVLRFCSEDHAKVYAEQDMRRREKAGENVLDLHYTVFSFESR